MYFDISLSSNSLSELNEMGLEQIKRSSSNSILSFTSMTSASFEKQLIIWKVGLKIMIHKIQNATH